MNQNTIPVFFPDKKTGNFESAYNKTSVFGTGSEFYRMEETSQASYDLEGEEE